MLKLPGLPSATPKSPPHRGVAPPAPIVLPPSPFDGHVPAQVSDVMDMDEIAFHEWTLQRALMAVESAKIGSIAYGKALRDAVDARQRWADAVKAKELAEQKSLERPMTPEERAEALSRVVTSASIDELEVVVHEYARRNRFDLVLGGDGIPIFVPFGQ